MDVGPVYFLDGGHVGQLHRAQAIAYIIGPDPAVAGFGSKSATAGLLERARLALPDHLPVVLTHSAAGDPLASIGSSAGLGVITMYLDTPPGTGHLQLENAPTAPAIVLSSCQPGYGAWSQRATRVLVEWYRATSQDIDVVLSAVTGAEDVEPLIDCATAIGTVDPRAAGDVARPGGPPVDVIGVDAMAVIAAEAIEPAGDEGPVDDAADTIIAVDGICEDDLLLVENLIEEIPAPSTGRRSIRFFECAPADPRGRDDLAQVVSELERRNLKTDVVHLHEQPASIGAVATANLVVTTDRTVALASLVHGAPTVFLQIAPGARAGDTGTWAIPVRLSAIGTNVPARWRAFHLHPEGSSGSVMACVSLGMVRAATRLSSVHQRRLVSQAANATRSYAESLMRLSDLEFEYQRLLLLSEEHEAAGSTPSLSEDRRDYTGTVDRIRQTIADRCDEGCIFVVVTKGDASLLQVPGRTGWHFPQDEFGAYAGFHPPNSHVAIAQLEEVRSRGASHFVLPEFAGWWLDHYTGFRAHLDALYSCVARTDHCTIYALTPVATGAEQR